MTTTLDLERLALSIMKELNEELYPVIINTLPELENLVREVIIGSPITDEIALLRNNYSDEQLLEFYLVLNAQNHKDREHTIQNQIRIQVPNPTQRPTQPTQPPTRDTYTLSYKDRVSGIWG